MHIGVFGVLNKALFQKFTGDVWRNTIFCRFVRFFPLAFKTLCFLCWPFLLLVLFSFAFFFTSSCCCWIHQVAMFWFLFLWFWASLVWLCVVCCFFFLFVLFFSTSLDPEPSLFVLFCFWFVFWFSLFAVVSSFVFAFVFFYWKSLRVRWGYPKGHLTWP